MLTTGDLRRVFGEMLPKSLMDEFAVGFGVVERERKSDIRAFVRSLVFGAGTPDGGLKVDALRSDLEMNVPEISRAAFYMRFDEELEKLLAALAEHAMQCASRLDVDLPGILGGVTDRYIADFETINLGKAVKELLSGSVDYAAIKVHKTLSLGTGVALRCHFLPAKAHDSKHPAIDESWRGYDLLADLGYASLARLLACLKHGVTFVIRLKVNWNAGVGNLACGTVAKTFFEGSDLDALIEDDVLVLDERAINCDGTECRQLTLCRMGIPTPKGHRFFLTNLPPRVGPWQVGEIYRVRWEVEQSMKLDKSIQRKDQTKATKAATIKTMLYAGFIASSITAILVHRHHLATHPEMEPSARSRQCTRCRSPRCSTSTLTPSRAPWRWRSGATTRKPPSHDSSRRMSLTRTPPIQTGAADPRPSTNCEGPNSRPLERPPNVILGRRPFLSDHAWLLVVQNATRLNVIITDPAQRICLFLSHSYSRAG